MSAIVSDLQEALEQIELGNLPAAHRLAQRHEGNVIADSIHAIIHRREGDFSNSLYWWRRVGSARPNELIEVYGDPAKFTALVRSASSSDTSEIESREISAFRIVIQSLVSKGEK
jgi:hypothetical protein